MSAPNAAPKVDHAPAKSPNANVLVDGFATKITRYPENAAEVKGRERDFFHTLCPRNYLQAWLADDASLMTLRLERCARIERRERDRIALRAEFFWDDDRKTEAEEIGSRLAGDPAKVVDRLRKTPQGCDWLMRRWALLAREIDRVKAWDAGQTAMAFDLLGTPAKFRNDEIGREIDEDGRVSEGKPDLAAFARSQIAKLRGRRAAVAEADALDRALAMADMTEQSTPKLRRLRRYENGLHRRLKWDLYQLQQEPKNVRPNPELAYLYDAEPAPASLAEPEADRPASAPEPRPRPEPRPIMEAEPAKPWMPPPIVMTDHIRREMERRNREDELEE